MEWQDPEPHDEILHVAVMTGWGSTGEWTVCTGDVVSLEPTASVQTTEEPTPQPTTLSPTTSHPTSTAEPSQVPTFQPTTRTPTRLPTSDPIASEPTFAPSSSPVTSIPTREPSVSPSKPPTETCRTFRFTCEDASTDLNGNIFTGVYTRILSNFGVEEWIHTEKGYNFESQFLPTMGHRWVFTSENAILVSEEFVEAFQTLNLWSTYGTDFTLLSHS
jgi:hypothetical protein